MKLSKLQAKQYRGLRETTIELSDLNLFIGANASGKSTILDTLRFLHEGIEARDFRGPVYSRGGIVHLAWKGQEAQQIELVVHLEGDSKAYEWSILIDRDGYEFHVEEDVHSTDLDSHSPPAHLLSSNKGEGWWWSGDEGGQVTLKQAPTSCALAAASADASFPAREVMEFISRWGFFDPNPFLLRRDWAGLDSGRFDAYGRNLGETLFALRSSSPDVFNQIVATTQAIIGLPSEVEPRESEDRFYFVQREPGLEFSVNQMGVSSGTLRMLALVTALHGEPETNLIGIEEPENYIHPTALSAFAEHLLHACRQAQIMVTTHSPLLLDFLNDPEAVNIVRRNGDEGTTIVKESNPDKVQKALEVSGFGLGEFYETKGFGS